MADNRYGGSGGYGRGGDWRSRGSSSIFSDDDDDRFARGGQRWSRDHGRGREEERGFFERAGDEIRSWFGDDEAERRRERDYRSNEAGGTSSGRDYSRTRYGPGGFGAYETGRQSGGRGAFFGGGSGGGRSEWDDNYLRWREQQIAALDRDYEDYCRERQQTFDREFDSWRTGRQSGSTGATGTSGGMTGTSAMTAAGGTTATRGSATGGTQGAAGATTTGAGTASATQSSTGSGGGATRTRNRS